VDGKSYRDRIKCAASKENGSTLQLKTTTTMSRFRSVTATSQGREEEKGGKQTKESQRVCRQDLLKEIYRGFGLLAQPISGKEEDRPIRGKKRAGGQVARKREPQPKN